MFGPEEEQRDLGKGDSLPRVHSIILAAGYATRLRPLTDHLAKPLLPLAGRPIVERIYDVLCSTRGIEAVHVVTNSRYAGKFREWAAVRDRPIPVHVHDDGTSTNETRRGAIGDVQYVVDQASLAQEDLLIVAGDNLLGPWMAAFVDFWQGHAAHGPASATAVYRCPDPELVKQYSVVELDANDRLVSFVEKPAEPKSDLVGIATYGYHRAHVGLIREYLDAGNSPDQPGNFLAWLHGRAPVYGYAFEGEWMDIGNAAQLLAADNMVRAHEGKPARETYEVDAP